MVPVVGIKEEMATRQALEQTVQQRVRVLVHPMGRKVITHLLVQPVVVKEEERVVRRLNY